MTVFTSEDRLKPSMIFFCPRCGITWGKLLRDQSQWTPCMNSGPADVCSCAPTFGYPKGSITPLIPKEELHLLSLPALKYEYQRFTCPAP